jgi:hypothetical protein
MTNSNDRDERDEFYEEPAKKNLLLNLKNPLSWYYAARRLMLLANKIRAQIEADIPAVNEGDDQFFPGVFTPNRLGDVFWLQTLRARIRNDLSGDYFVGDEVNFDTEDTIDKDGLEMFSEPKYRKLHPLYPLYLYFIGAAIETLLKAICIMRLTTSIYLYSESNLEIVLGVVNKGHKLLDLAVTGLQLPLDEAEKHLLRMLEDFILWVGKYPGPKTSKQYEAFVRGTKHPNPFSEKERPNFSKDERRIHNLYERLLNVLDNEAKERLRRLSAEG